MDTTLPDIAGCSSDRDLVTLVDWTDAKPSIFINFINDVNKPGRLNCYDGDSLKYWLNLKENTFAKWVAHDVNKGMDAVGHDGGPDANTLYVKLYTGEYLVVDDLIKKLKKGFNQPMMFDALSSGIKRLGNLRGHFGVSDTHGHAPGYRVYTLKAITKIPEPEVKPLMKTNFSIPTEIKSQEDFYLICEKGGLNLFQHDELNYNLNKGLYYACKGNRIYNIDILIHLGARDWIEAFKGTCAGGNVENMKEYKSELKELSSADLVEAIAETCKYGHLNIIKALNDELIYILKFNIGMFTSLRCFQNACYSGNFDLVKYLYSLLDLLDNKMKRKQLDSGMFGAGEGNHPEILEYLINKARIPYYANALAGACKGGHLELVDSFIQNYHFANDKINRALLFACEGGNMEILKLIVDHGADDFLTSFPYACKSDNLKLIEYIWRMSRLSTDEENFNIGFMNACGHGNLEIVEYIDKNIGIYMEDFNYLDGFMSACEKGQIKVVNYLKEKDYTIIDLNDAFNITCLNGNLNIVKFLINTFETRDHDVQFDYNSGLDAAYTDNQLPIARFLVEKGADRRGCTSDYINDDDFEILR